MLSKHDTYLKHGVNWLDADLPLTADFAKSGLGLPNPSAYMSSCLFNRLPYPVAKSNLSPAAKSLYADIFSYVFRYTAEEDKKVRTDPAVTIKEYFFGWQTIRQRVHTTKATVFKTLKELVDNQWINTADPLATSSPVNKYVPLVKFGPVFYNHDQDESLHIKPVGVGKPVTVPVATRLRFYPIFLNMLLLYKTKRVTLTDVILFGFIVAKASPIVFASHSRIAEEIGVYRKTVTRGLERLMKLHLINICSKGIYVTASPALAMHMHKDTNAELKKLLFNKQEKHDGIQEDAA